MEDNKDEKTEETTTLQVPEIQKTDDDEEELLPPEEQNEAKQIDVVNIMIVAFVIFFVFVLVINFGGIKNNKKEEDITLKTASGKYDPNFNLKSTDKPEETPKGIEDISSQFENTEVGDKVTPTDEDINKALKDKGLDDDFLNPASQTEGTAPVVKQTTTTTAVSTRPDTKNSKSPRSIQGIAGLPQTPQAKSATDVISSVMNGTYQPPQTVSRDEYVSNALERYASMYGPSGAYGSENGTSGSSNYSDDIGKNEFYNAQNTTAGNGSFLPVNTLWDGTIISGALVTAINTDSPGLVIARVTENVYSSLDHSYLLIPEGTILHGSYNSSVTYGQDSIQVAWNLLIRPDGYRLELGNMNGVNSQGASGYSAYVNNHPFETLKALGLVAIFSVIQAEVNTTIDNQNNKYMETAMTDVYTEASKLGNKILDKALDIKPTLKKQVGEKIKLITNTPLTLPPVEMFTPNKAYVRTR